MHKNRSCFTITAMDTCNLTAALLSSKAGLQWKSIGIRKHTGIALPLFSLHSNKSCGIGEFPDLLPLLPWCSAVGFDVIQLLPLNDTGLDSSPYSAISAFALNPLYLGLSRLPYSDSDPSLKIQIENLQKLNNTQKLHYTEIRVGKEQFLREYYHKYHTKLPYGNFKKENAHWLKTFTLFKALKVKNNWHHWESWPEEERNPTPDFINSLSEILSEEMDYHAFVQYLCFTQMTEVKNAATSQHIFIKGDIPILINRDSADVWSHRELFLMAYAAGAPPDMYSQEGQKWGFPLYNWAALADQDYRWWIERLNVASLCYHIYRIDHIVGFFRIWAIPLDKPAKEGAFIPADPSLWIPQGKTIMEMMLKNCSMLPIGEDLGTVPPEVRVCLKELGICGTKVMRWEKRWDGDKGFIDPKAFPQESMTTVSTHDSETLAMWWRDDPKEARLYAETFGLIYAEKLTRENRAAILYESHQSGSLFHINLLQEYLALIPWMEHEILDDERINVPGTITDNNWTYKFKPTLEQFTSCIPLKQSIQIQNDIPY